VSHKDRPRGPVSPVAPRRTAVAAVVPPADLSLPCALLHVSGVSYGDGIRPCDEKCKRLGTVPGMQEEAAEKIDAGLRAALAE
jgi:hypothetical protein